MKNKFLASALVFSFLFCFAVVSVSAQTPSSGNNQPGGATAGTQTTNIQIKNPLAKGDTISQLFLQIIDDLLIPIGAILAVLAFIYSGFLYVMAQGNATKIETAHKALLYSAIGTALLLGAKVILSVITNTVDQLRT